MSDKVLTNRDYTGRSGAEVMARQITEYWAKLGWYVQCEVVQADCAAREAQGRTVWAVRTDMVNGMPRRRIAQ